jgi:RNA polymerase sigma-70 factor (sigma-E family)
VTEKSFEEFVHASLPALSRHAYALTGGADAGQDLLQDTLVKVARAWRRIRREGNPLAYTRTVMLNTYLSAWRALRRRGVVVPYDEDASTAGDAYAQIDSRDVLRRALAALPRDQRAVLVLGYLDDLTDDEIAGLIDRRPATVRSLRHRALQTLRARLGGPNRQEESHV